MPPTLGEELAGQRWCTGAVVPHDLTPALAPHLRHPSGAHVTVQPDDWLVVVSHACDVLARTLEAEPYVEVLHCKPIERLRAQYKELRSTRVLDFKPNRATHEPVVLSAHAVADRFLVPRNLLRDRAPDSARRLSDIATARVLSWYALRYGRPIWPDEFGARIGKTKTALEEALAPLKDDIAEVRVSIAEKDQELGEDDSYHIAAFFVIDEAVWEGDADGRAAIQAAFAKFVSVLDGCNGIEVNQELSGVMSGAKFTWQDTRATDEWNFANLSQHD